MVRFQLIDYLVIRKDRKGQSNHWGGTVIYHHQDLNIYELVILENNLEAIWMEAVIKTCYCMHLSATKGKSLCLKLSEHCREFLSQVKYSASRRLQY